MAIGDLTALPDGLANAIQEKLIARMYLDSLLNTLAYARQASPMPIASHIGATLSFTRLSELAVDGSPLNPADMNDLDNGLTPDEMNDEQFTFTLKRYAKTFNVNLLEQKAMIRDYVLQVAQRQGRQAARTRELLCRKKITDGAMAGNTVVTELVGDGLTSCKVDDIRGLMKIMKSGNLENVSNATGLRLSVENLTHPAITLQIIGATPDSTSYSPETDSNNHSSAKAVGGISGTITYVAVDSAPSVGDVLRAATASKILRPNGKSCTQALAPTDLFTTALAIAGKQALAERGVEADDDGFYRCIIPPATMTQLFSDADFKTAAQGQLNDPVMRYGKIVRHQGIEYVETTESILQAKGAGVDASKVNVAVYRPVLLGKGAIVRGDSKILDDFVQEKQQRSVVHDSQMLDGIEYTFRSPIDRLGEQFAMSWQMIVDYCAPTNAVSTPDLMPTSDNALFKNFIQFEHAA